MQDLHKAGTKTLSKVFSEKISGRTFYKIETKDILMGDIFFVSDIDFHKNRSRLMEDRERGQSLNYEL
jgi:hypothetical protein